MMDIAAYQIPDVGEVKICRNKGQGFNFGNQGILLGNRDRLG